MEISRRIQELLGLHPEVEQRDPEEIPIVGIHPTTDSWEVYFYSDPPLSREDRAWVWEELAAQAMLVLAQEVPEVKVRITTPLEMKGGDNFSGVIQYRYPPPENDEAFWWAEICRHTRGINALLAERISERWLVRSLGKRSDPAARIARRKAELNSRQGTRNKGARLN